jgi:hypothetical protein
MMAELLEHDKEQLFPSMAEHRCVPGNVGCAVGRDVGFAVGRVVGLTVGRDVVGRGVGLAVGLGYVSFR